MRTYAPVIVRGEEDKGVQIWGFGKTVYQTLMGLMLDEDYGDITDPTEGRDIKVLCTKQPGKKWAMTEVRPRGKQSPLSGNSETSNGWLTNIPDLTEIYRCKTYDELSKIVNDWINDDVSEEGTSASFEGNTQTKTSEDGSNSGYSSIDDAFADLMQD
jgi:hypothetical protein